MPSKSKAVNDAALLTAGISRNAYSIPEFCAAYNLSEGLYRKLRDQGLGPRETRVLRRVLITVEAADEWRRVREEASAANQEIVI